MADTEEKLSMLLVEFGRESFKSIWIKSKVMRCVRIDEACRISVHLNVGGSSVVITWALMRLRAKACICTGARCSVKEGCHVVGTLTGLMRCID